MVRNRTRPRGCGCERESCAVACLLREIDGEEGCAVVAAGRHDHSSEYGGREISVDISVRDGKTSYISMIRMLQSERH